MRNYWKKLHPTEEPPRGYDITDEERKTRDEEIANYENEILLVTNDIAKLRRQRWLQFWRWSPLIVQILNLKKRRDKLEKDLASVEWL